MNTEGNDPAFPDSNNAGLTKREYFAAMALQGILGNPEEVEMEGDDMEEDDMEEGDMEEGDSESESENDNGQNKRMEGESCLECSCRLAVEHADMLIRHLNK